MDSNADVGVATTPRRVFLTGATGYIGGRLAPRLLAAGYALRCLVRSPEKLSERAWTRDPRVEIVRGDLNDHAGLSAAMRGCGAAYYLVHSMVAEGADYAAKDMALAESFAKAAADAGVERIIYLGGLGELGEGLSEHLSSRRDVERALASGPVPVTTLRAAMIIGSGSASFEILRYLVERLPLMITPRWVSTLSQPIAVRNVLEYLIRCLSTPETAGKTLDIGGPDVLSYAELMRIMARQRGLPRRWIIPVPVLTPRLSSYWIHLVTPVGSRIARPLAEGLRNKMVCRDDLAHRLMPQDLLSAEEAIRLALEKVGKREIETIWSSAGALPGDPDWAGGTVFNDVHATEVNAGPHEVFQAVCRLGGENGYHACNWLWWLRGVLDRLVGGPGLRRGRRDPDRLQYGEALDFWRVTNVREDARLGLRAEMKLPGEALLEFVIEPLGAGRSRLTQTARFIPRGLLGLAYWYAVLPLHGPVFKGMLAGIRVSAEAQARGVRTAS